MVTNLRERVESDLAVTLQRDFALTVQLTDPDGLITTAAGQVLYDTVTMNPETGETVVANNPIVTLRRSTLARVPEPGEVWLVKIPTTPNTTATLEEFIIDSDRSPEGGRSIGFIRLYLRRVQQS